MEEEAAERASAPKRIALAALLTIVGLNVWTGGPLLALWVGSRVQGSGPPTMGAVFVVFVLFEVWFSSSLARRSTTAQAAPLWSLR